MSGRIQPLRAKRKPRTKAPGEKPNATRQHALAKRRRDDRARAFKAAERARRAFLAERQAKVEAGEIPYDRHAPIAGKLAAAAASANDSEE